MKLSILKPGGEIPLIEQKSDNTNVKKPKIEEPVERTVNGVKWSDLDFKTQMMNRGNLVDGYPTEKGLEIVSPEFDIISGVRGITNLLPKTQTFYHGSPVRFNKFNTEFIGSGEGGSKAMKGINLWPDNHFGAAPKFANIRSSDAPLHLGRASKEISGELNPTIYKVRGRNLKIYRSNTSKGLDQQELVNLGYDGFSNGSQYTIFPESVNKLKESLKALENSDIKENAITNSLLNIVDKKIEEERKNNEVL